MTGLICSVDQVWEAKSDNRLVKHAVFNATANDFHFARTLTEISPLNGGEWRTLRPASQPAEADRYGVQGLGAT